MMSSRIQCLYFVFALLWGACKNIDTQSCPGNSDSEIANILRWEEYYKDRIQFARFSTDSNIIRYRYDAAREHLALNVVKRNDQYLLQIFEELGFFVNQRTSIFKEIPLSQGQVDHVLSKIEKVKCLPYNLDEYRWSSHSNQYFLMFEHNGSIGAIKWIHGGERSRDVFGNEAVNPYKRITQDLCGYLIRLTGLPLSEKGIVLNDSYQGDSLQYEVFVKRGYVFIDYTVLFDGQVLSRNEWGVTNVMVTKSDSQNIKNRIKIREKQWGDTISVY